MRPRFRLWMKLAALAAAGVVAMHVVHLTLGNRIATRALTTEKAALGRQIARVVAQHAADPLLVSDRVQLHEIVTSTVAGASDAVAYCFIVRDQQVIASSFTGATPPALVRLRAPGDRHPVIVKAAEIRVLDVVEPILGGDVGEVRLGLKTDAVAALRHQLAVHLGALAVAVIAAGLVAAFVLGRSIARPVSDILASADRFDPAGSAVPTVAPRGSDELAVLGDRFNRMMLRLKAAHLEQQEVRRKAVETQRLVALGSLVAGVAHEVNNPLAGLKNCLGRLQRGALAEAKRREYLELMDEGLGRIEDLMKRLLDFGRPRPMALARLRTRELAAEAVHLMEPLLQERGIRCAVQRLEADAEVHADRRKIGQALVNLLLNSAYVTAPGAEIELRLVRRDGMRGIAVADRGPGIPADVRDRILDPFFSTKPEGEGTGLGLSVTRSIVDAHGGELSFDFPAEGGTVATVWLPAAVGAPSALPAAVGLATAGIAQPLP
jgi:two-component system NtrC family sensor kinase